MVKKPNFPLDRLADKLSELRQDVSRQLDLGQRSVTMRFGVRTAEIRCQKAYRDRPSTIHSTSSTLQATWF